MALLVGLDTAILPKHKLEGEAYLTSTFHSAPIGTGPFKFKEWVKGSHIILERNEEYFAEGKPYLDKLVVKIVPDPGTISALFKRGEVDYVFRGIPYEAYGELKGLPELEVYLHTRPPYKTVIEINNQHPILSNVKVRQAIAYALNRSEIVSRATLGLCKVTDSYWTPGITPSSPNRAIYNCDPAKAEGLLDEAGYKRGPDGERFSIELLIRRGEPEELLVSELIRDQLSRVGIRVTVKAVDFGVFLDIESSYQYDICLLKRWVTPFWTYQLFSSSWIKPGVPFSNTVVYNNTEVDRYFDLWIREADLQKQKEYLQKCEEIVSHDVPEILLYDLVFINVKRKTFQGPDIPVGKYMYWDSLENIYWTESEASPTGPSIWMWAGAVIVAVMAIAAIGVFAIRRRKGLRRST